jgi:hypothetical protein
LFVFVPLFAWLAFVARAAWRRAWLTALGFVVGSAPWLAWNARHDWDSLSFPPGLPRTTYMTRWRGFFTHALPQLMGVREPYAQNWRFGALGVACYLAVLALVVAALVLVLRDRDRRRRLAPVVAIALSYPFLYAAPKTSWYMGEPRYMMLFIPIAVVAAGALGTTVWRQAGIGVLAVLLAVATVHDLDHYGKTRSSAVFAYAPDTRSLVRVLDAHHVHAVFADYWIAYPLTFATDRRILATPVDVVREHGIARAVYATTPSTYVLYVHSDRDAALADDLAARGIGYDRVIVGQFAVFFCDRNVLPGSLSPGLWLANGYSA